MTKFSKRCLTYNFIVVSWDLTGFDCQEEQPRPQYLARVERLKSRSKPKINVITGVIERKVPFWTIRFPATILSFSIVLLLVNIN